MNYEDKFRVITCIDAYVIHGNVVVYDAKKCDPVEFKRNVLGELERKLDQAFVDLEGDDSGSA